MSILQSIRVLTCTARDTIYRRNVWACELAILVILLLGCFSGGVWFGHHIAPRGTLPGRYVFRFDSQQTYAIDNSVKGRLIKDEHLTMLDFGIEVRPDAVWVVTPPKLITDHIPK